MDCKICNHSAYTDSLNHLPQALESTTLLLTTASKLAQGTEIFFSKLNLDWMFWWTCLFYNKYFPLQLWNCLFRFKLFLHPRIQKERCFFNVEISCTGPIVLWAKSHFMFLKDLFIDTFLAHLISYTTTYHRRDVTTSLKTFLKCDLKQPKKLYQYHTDLFSTYNDLLQQLGFAWKFFFLFLLVSSEKLTHLTTIVFYSNLFKFLGFKSSLINKNFQ